ncbi:MAG: hypothetical protein PUP93_17410 [Rhizonema sp. NSF051]|nr:hypothetical protein [Rhizonema sp. NSF051]
MSALINQHPYFDVEFNILNDLANRLRTAGAKFSVRKVASKHRITVVKEPTIATFEQIIIYTMGEDSIDTPEESNNNVASSPNLAHKETTDTPNPQELAVSLESDPQESVVAGELAVPLELEAPQELVVAPVLASSAELKSLPMDKLKKLAKHHKVTGLSKIKLEKLAAKLEGLVTKEQLA